jgi:hypothetical protein
MSIPNIQYGIEVEFCFNGIATLFSSYSCMFLYHPNSALLASCAGGLGALAAVCGKLANKLRACPGLFGVVSPIIMWGMLLVVRDVCS